VDLTIEAYAAVMAELADAGEARAEALARRGLDDARWEAIDAHWQQRLSEALEQEDGVADVITAYAAAYEAAQRALAPPISLEQFALVTRFLQASGDIRASLSKVGVTLADYVRGSEHWSRQLAQDPDLERRFNDVLRDGSGGR
jgi:hypothetical protein